MVVGGKSLWIGELWEFSHNGLGGRRGLIIVDWGCMNSVLVDHQLSVS
jgi:hypothetical protein